MVTAPTLAEPHGRASSREAEEDGDIVMEEAEAEDQGSEQEGEEGDSQEGDEEDDGDSRDSEASEEAYLNRLYQDEQDLSSDGSVYEEPSSSSKKSKSKSARNRPSTRHFVPRPLSLDLDSDDGAPASSDIDNQSQAEGQSERGGDGDAGVDPVTGKRKRGRPRKVKIVEPKEKRPIGRPRKNPVQARNDDAEDEDEEDRRLDQRAVGKGRQEGEEEGEELSDIEGDDQGEEDHRQDIFDQFIEDALNEAPQPSGSRNLSTKDSAMVDPLDALRDDLALARGFKSKQKGRRRGRRRKAIPEHLQPEVQKLEEAFINGNHEYALELAGEIVRQDPMIPDVWATMAGIHGEKGNTIKAIGCRIYKASLTLDVTDWLQLMDSAREAGMVETFEVALARAVAADKHNERTMYLGAQHYSEKGDDVKAIKYYKRLFRVNPFNWAYLREALPIFASGTFGVDVYQGIEFAEAAFDYHVNTTIYEAPNVDGEGIIDSANMTPLDFVNLSDLLSRLREFERAADVIRRGCRWMEDRMLETYWDDQPDDREYDPPNTYRKLEGTVDSEENGDTWNDMPFALRVRICILRLRLNQEEDAEIHLLLINNAHEEADLRHPIRADLAKALMDHAQYTEADALYQGLHELDVILSPEHWLHWAICKHNLTLYDEAVGLLEQICAAEDLPEDLRLNAKSQLASVLEDRNAPGDLSKALQLVREVREANHRAVAEVQNEQDAVMEGRETQDTNNHGLILPDQPQIASYIQVRALARANRKEAEAEAKAHTATLLARTRTVEQAAFAGDPVAKQSFIADARQMVTELRRERSLYPKDRSVRFVDLKKRHRVNVGDFIARADDDAERLEDRVKLEEDEDANDPSAESRSEVYQKQQTRFLGLHADDWLDMAVKFACLLMRDDRNIEVMQMAQHMNGSTLFHPEKYKVTLWLTVLAAAMREKDHDMVLNTIREISTYYQFRSEPWHLLSALGSGYKALDRYENTTLQKFTARQLHMWSAVAFGCPATYNDNFGKWAVNVQEWLRHPSRQALKQQFSSGQGFAAIQQKGKKGKTSDVGSEADSAAESDDAASISARSNPDDLDLRAIMFPGYRPEKPILPKKRPMAVGMVYGHTLAMAKSNQGAIAYYLRVYEVDPFDPVVCLCLAQAYLSRSQQRQCDNKLHAITIGMTFLSRYRALRHRDAKYRPEMLEEVEYNFARAFAGVGMLNLAVKHYRNALRSVEARMSESGDPEAVQDKSIAREAAYNLMGIYLLTGSTPNAKAISDKWLAI